MLRVSIILFLLLLLTQVSDANNMKAFSPPAEGMERYVLHLPKKANERLYKVELMIGKTVLVDSENHFFFAGRIDAQTIQGWGFTQYVLSELGPMAGTRMAVSSDAPSLERFVGLRGDPYLISYNSRLPIVIYVPNGVEVHYRIWSADSKIYSMDGG